MAHKHDPVWKQMNVTVNPWIFVLLWSTWTIGYTATVQYRGGLPLAIDNAPNIAFISTFLGSILFPRLFWWFAMVLFTVLFSVNMIGQIMHNTSIFGAISSLLIASFGLNLSIGVTAGLIARRIAKIFMNTNNRHDFFLSIIGFVFVYMVAAALAIFALMYVVAWAILPLNEAASHGFSAMGLQLVLFRAIRSGAVAALAMVLYFYPLRRSDMTTVLGGIIVLSGAALLQLYGGLPLAELQIAVIILAATIAVSPSAAASIGLFGAVPFAFFTGVFVMGDLNAATDEMAMQGIASLVLVAVVLVLILKTRAYQAQLTRTLRLERAEELRIYSGIGVFQADLERRILHFDPIASTMTGLPEEVSFETFIRHIGPKSAKAFQEILSAPEPFTSPTAVTIEAPSPSGGRQFTATFMQDEDHNFGTFLQGFLRETTQQFRTRRRLERTSDRLKHLRRRNAMILNYMTHEMVRPLDECQMQLDALISDDPQRNAAIALLDRSHRRVQGMLSNLRILLKPTRTRTGGGTSVDMPLVLEKLRNDWELLAKQSGITISTLPTTQRMADINVDVTQLRDILDNLVQITLDRSRGKGLWLSCTLDNSVHGAAVAVLTVEDDGTSLTGPAIRAWNQYINDPDAMGATDVRIPDLNKPPVQLMMTVDAAMRMGGSIKVVQGIRDGLRSELRIPLAAITVPTSDNKAVRPSDDTEDGPKTTTTVNWKPR